MIKKILFTIAVFVVIDYLYGLIIIDSKYNTEFFNISKNDAFIKHIVHDRKFVKVKFNEHYIYSNVGGRGVVNWNNKDGHTYRNSPDSCNKDSAFTIYAFGGSTLQNAGSSDENTIANQIAKNLNYTKCTRIYNFGVGSYTIDQEIIRFLSIMLDRGVNIPEPDLVLFYEGFNDIVNPYFYGVGRMQLDIYGKLKAIVEADNYKMFLYFISISMKKISNIYEDVLASKIEYKIFSSGIQDKGSHDVGMLYKHYINAYSIRQSLCLSMNVECLTILQPLLLSKSNLSKEEEVIIDILPSKLIDLGRDFYKMISLNLRDDKSFIDASNILDTDESAMFYDFGHTRSDGGVIIGRLLTEKICSYVQSVCD